MLFNSYEFIFLFLPIVLGVYWLLRNYHQPRLLWLLLASYAFYAYWDVRFSALIILVTVVDFIAGAQIYHAETPRAKRLWLYGSLVINLGVLGFFKYYNFFAGSVNDLQHQELVPVLNVVLPIGISFYTFQAMSYVIDIYREEVKPTPSLLRFALYVIMFPQLIAGPIVRYTDIAERLNDPKSDITWERIDKGLFFFIIGLAKKVIVADQIGEMVNFLLIDYEGLRFFGSWIVAIGYTYQLYFDFSGYSDMAVGLGHLLGFDFPRNFDSPYAARNISDFWRRWHITLSNWLRDYLFISLGGSRGSRFAVLRNLMITMLLGGLWHGAAWNFVIWGAYHGFLLILFHAWRLNGLPKWNTLLARGGTFLLVIIGWIIFRATSLDMASHLYQSMIGLNGIENIHEVAALPKFNVYIMCLFAFAFVSTNLYIDTWELPIVSSRWATVGLGIMFVMCVMLIGQPSSFLYFQF